MKPHVLRTRRWNSLLDGLKKNVSCLQQFMNAANAKTVPQHDLMRVNTVHSELTQCIQSVGGGNKAEELISVLQVDDMSNADVLGRKLDQLQSCRVNFASANLPAPTALRYYTQPSPLPRLGTVWGTSTWHLACFLWASTPHHRTHPSLSSSGPPMPGLDRHSRRRWDTLAYIHKHISCSIQTINIQSHTPTESMNTEPFTFLI